ncbi:MAG: TIGR03084 family protein [Hyphomonadaceae bacterium]|nr:TIGR03084 family protein [Hyphomonadaceae bacterium]
MQEAWDFKDESDAIAAVLDGKTETDFETVTLFKNWTIKDIIGHLHLWNIAADLTLNKPEEFMEFVTEKMSLLMQGKSHPELQEEVFKGKSGLDIYDEWKAYYPEMAERFAKADPDHRVKWAGPDMSVLSCIIARQMENWAHAQAIFDVFGLDRVDTDRLKNVAHIGVTTYSWSFKVRGEEPILPKPYVRLTAPSGAIWEWNEPQDDNKVEGSATEFSQVVTQTRNVGDTGLTLIGEAATTWMNNAQCFAGGAETPPVKGARRKA